MSPSEVGLSAEQIDTFIHRGFVRLDRAFPRELADACRAARRPLPPPPNAGAAGRGIQSARVRVPSTRRWSAVDGRVEPPLRRLADSCIAPRRLRTRS